jgi:hypothetical protein
MKNLTDFNNFKLDMGKISIERNLDNALSDEPDLVRNAINVIECASAHGRKMAGVFLMGLLVSSDDNWTMKEAIVYALRFTKTKQCAALLCSELRRVKSNNTTRRYLGTIIKVLRYFPEEIIGPEFALLAEDRSFSPKMRKKFRLEEEDDYDWW